MSLQQKSIRSPNQAELGDLGNKLRELSILPGSTNLWPEQQLKLCGDAGVFRWFLPKSWGGYEWSQSDIVNGYIALSAACLKTTFVITQRTAACNRIVASDNDDLKQQLLPDLAAGNSFATVGISHLTTSHRHVDRPVLRAQAKNGDYIIDGFSPWVTGGQAADHVVMGAEMEDGQQILFALPARTPGVSLDPPHQLIALTGSQTGAIRCSEVVISRDLILAGPDEIVLATGTGGATGGLQTSTLALGLAKEAIDFIEAQSHQREELTQNFTSLRSQHVELTGKLLQAASGSCQFSKEDIRTDANSLVLRSTQSALVAAKGAGFVEGHPAGRWCQEALFFLVWSCPQSVLDANLCELAGIVNDD